jgi:hypothetical protein
MAPRPAISDGWTGTEPSSDPAAGQYRFSIDTSERAKLVELALSQDTREGRLLTFLFVFHCGLLHKRLREIAIGIDGAICPEFISPWMQVSNTIV